MMEIIFSSDFSRNIVEDFVRGSILEYNLDKSRKNYHNELNEIRTIYGTKNTENTILKYAGKEMEKNVEKERNKTKIFDWDALTYKDENGELISLLCSHIKEADQKTKQLIEYNIVKKIEENIIKYFSKEFEEKVDEEICRQTSNNDYDETSNYVKTFF